MPIKLNGTDVSLYKGENKPVNLFLGDKKAVGWVNSAKEGEAAEWEETYDDYLDGTINGFSTQANPYYREEENTSIVVTENQDAALEKCEINGVSELINEYELSEGLSTLQNDYVGKDGISSQVVTVLGKNLLDRNLIVSGYINGSGVFTATPGHYISDYCSVLASTSYILSSTVNIGYLGVPFYFDINKTFQSVGTMGAGGTFTTVANTAYVILRSVYNYVADYGDVDMQNANWQLEVGSTATAYAPFVPNSPSPDYPSKIWSTKNLFDLSVATTTADGVQTLIPNGIKLTKISDGLRIGEKIRVNSFTGNITISATIVGTGLSIRLWNETVLISGTESVISTSKSYSGIGTVTHVQFFVNMGNANGSEIFITNIQLELGSTATAYEPILKAGNYKITDGADIFEFALPDDIRGIGSVQDRVVFDRINHVGWVDKKISEVILNGTETWEYESASHGYYRSFTNKAISNIDMYCSHFKYITQASLMPLYSYRYGGNTNLLFNYDDGVGGVDGFKAWILTQYNAGKPLIVSYKTASSTRTTLTFTKVSSSTLPEFPATALTVTQSPDYPYTIAPFVKAGTYKITTDNGIYETTLADDMRGVGDYKDKIVFDSYNGKGWRETKIYKKVFDGSESISFGGSMTTTSMFLYGAVYAPSLPVGDYIDITKTNHFNNVLNYSTDVEGCFINHVKILYFRINSSRLSSLDSSGVKAWLTAEYTAGRPVTTIYPLATPTRTNLTFTKVTSSSAPELPSSALSTGSGRNKFNKDTVTVDKVIDNTNGVLWNSTVNNVTPFIPVSASQYTISGHTYVQSGSVGLAWYTSANAYISGTTFDTVTGNGVYIRPATAAYVRYTVNDVDLATSQLEVGGVANPYESYFTPNVPNSNYPVSITSVDEPTLQSSSKNLINIADHNVSYINSQFTTYVPVNSPKLLLFPSRTYTLSFDYVINSNSLDNVQVGVGYGCSILGQPAYNRDISWSSYPNNSSGRLVKTFTTPSSFSLYSPAGMLIGIPYLSIRYAWSLTSATVNVDISNVIFSYDTHASLPYEPYQGITLPYTTSPLYSLSASIYDKLNVLRGKEIHNIGVKVFDGTENWVAFNTNEFYYLEVTPLANGSYALMKCTHTISSNSTIFFNSSNQIRVYLSKLFSSLAIWKAFLVNEYAKGTPVTVVYQLATPTEVAQTSQSVPLYSPLTNIFTDKGKVKVGYKLKDSTVKVGTDIIAPHPDYKSDILSAGGNVKSRGRNLWTGEKKYTFYDYASSTLILATRFLKPNTSYTFVNRFKTDAPSMSNNRLIGCLSLVQMNYFPADNIYYSLDTIIVQHYTTPSIIQGGLYCYGVPGYKNTFDDIMIIEGTHTLDDVPYYLPYRTPTQIILPTLRAIKLAADATDQNYTDSEGNKWCADTLQYKGLGVWEHVQRVGVNLLDGITVGNKVTVIGYELGVYYCAISSTATIATSSLRLKSTHFKPLTTYASLGSCNINSAGQLCFTHTNQELNTVIKMNTYINDQYVLGTPIIFHYILATPIVTQLTLGELKTFPHYTAVEQDGSTKTFMNLSAKVQDYTI